MYVNKKFKLLRSYEMELVYDFSFYLEFVKAQHPIGGPNEIYIFNFKVVEY